MPKINYEILNFIDNDEEKKENIKNEESKTEDIYYSLYNKANEINTIFPLFVNNVEEFDTDLVDNKLITKVSFDSFIKNIYDSLSENYLKDELENDQLLEKYKIFYKDFLRHLLKQVFLGYSSYNNRHNDKKTISNKEIKTFIKTCDDLLKNTFESITDIKMPNMGNMNNSEFSMLVEDILSFKILEKKEHTNIDNLDRKIKDNLSRSAYNNALKILTNKPLLINNETKNVIIDDLNVTSVNDYLLKLRYEYKEIERIHLSRSLYQKIVHPFNYLREKNTMKTIISKAKKMFENTNTSIKVEGVISGKEDNFQLNSTHFKDREMKTIYLENMLESLGVIDKDNTFGIKLDNRNYEDSLKFKKSENIHKVNYQDKDEENLIDTFQNNEVLNEKNKYIDRDINRSK